MHEGKKAGAAQIAQENLRVYKGTVTTTLAVFPHNIKKEISAAMDQCRQKMHSLFEKHDMHVNHIFLKNYLGGGDSNEQSVCIPNASAVFERGFCL